jgi:CrcB protein
MGIWLSVIAGGAIGSLSRFLVASQVGHWLPNTRFPLGTFAVNVIGCLIAGALVEVFAFTWSPSPEARALLVTGFLGGFTTFSAFSIDVFYLIEKGDVLLAIGYVLASILVSFAAFFAAQSLFRLILS